MVSSRAGLALAAAFTIAATLLSTAGWLKSMEPLEEKNRPSIIAKLTRPFNGQMV